MNAATGKETGKKAKAEQLQKDQKLQEVLQELEAQRARPGGFSAHPKMDTLKTLLVEHFAQRQFDREDGNGGGDDSRVMVFVSYRQCIDEVIALLNHERPLIRAVPFIGQGTDKNGKKGYGQKEQLEVRLIPAPLLYSNKDRYPCRSSSGSRRANSMCLCRRQLARKGSILARSI